MAEVLIIKKPSNLWPGFLMIHHEAVLRSGGGLHPLNQEVKVRRGELGLLVGEQSQRSVLHRFHGFDHPGHWHAKTVVHLSCTDQADVLNQLRTTCEYAIGHES